MSSAAQNDRPPPLSDADISSHTDRYFRKSRRTVAKFGDARVTYAVFMRRPVVFTPKFMVEWLEEVAAVRGTVFDIDLRFEEGERVGAGEPLAYISGSMHDLVDLETLYLQKLGAPCVAAYNAYVMCCDLPKVAFMAFDARHCAGTEMAEMMAYAASVGSRAAQQDVGAVGFVGCATDSTAAYFGCERGLGTMPHALIGYAGSTLRAAEMFHETFPDEPLYVLVDYFGCEITDTLEICAHFPELAAEGQLGVRLDTHGSRFVEGLDPERSYEVLQRHDAFAVKQYRNENELRWLLGTGVSAAAICHVRQTMDNAGYDKVKIIASSGFSPAKCKVMASVKAPIDMIGTGSYLPENWPETYATADIVEYDGKPQVKVGREFLLKNARGRSNNS